MLRLKTGAPLVLAKIGPGEGGNGPKSSMSLSTSVISSDCRGPPGDGTIAGDVRVRTFVGYCALLMYPSPINEFDPQPRRFRKTVLVGRSQSRQRVRLPPRKR
jgi:hypothetical protein